MFPFEWIQQAHERIAPYIKTTPLTRVTSLDAFIKWENHQITGSFKARGAINKVLSLQPWEREHGLVAVSAGNHGQGVALAGNLVNTQVTVFCSENAVLAKVAAMRRLGAQVIPVSGGYAEAERAGKSFATERGAAWISPYNDSQVIAGQGTIALEVFQQAPELADAACWLVPISGGGLIAGIAVAVKERNPDAKVIGVQTYAAPFFYGLFYQGSQENIAETPSLADGLAGPVEEGSLTIPVVREYVDEIILITEQDIEKAIAWTWSVMGEIIEGSAAVTLAALFQSLHIPRPAIAVVSGGNIQPEVHQQIVSKFGDSSQSDPA